MNDKTMMQLKAELRIARAVYRRARADRDVAMAAFDRAWQEAEEAYEDYEEALDAVDLAERAQETPKPKDD